MPPPRSPSPSGTDLPWATACIRGSCRAPAWMPLVNKGEAATGPGGKKKKSLRRLKVGRRYKRTGLRVCTARTGAKSDGRGGGRGAAAGAVEVTERCELPPAAAMPSVRGGDPALCPRPVPPPLVRPFLKAHAFAHRNLSDGPSPAVRASARPKRRLPLSGHRVSAQRRGPKHGA